MRGDGLYSTKFNVEEEFIDMIINRKLSDDMLNTLVGAKKVSSVQITPDKFWAYMLTINVWNNTKPSEKFDVRFEDSDYYVPSKLKELILPSHVSFTGELNEHNFVKYVDVVKEKDDSTDILSNVAFNEISDAISGVMKWDRNNESVKTLRNQSGNFTSWLDKKVKKDGDMVVYNKQAYRPIALTIDDIHSEYAYNVKAETMLLNWWRKCLEISSPNN